MTWEENDYLVHYGVKGQKWHVRNYQNPDGTLTAEGKARYAGQRDRGDSGLLKKWTIGSNAGAYAFAKWRGRRHDKNISKINKKYSNDTAKREKKLAKYESKRQAQGAANSDMDAYRRHRSTASLMLTTAGYKHARARGAGRGRAFVEGFVPVAGLGLRMAGDKKKYGKRIVFGAPNDNEYDAMAMDRD